ncbi:hypothetical protein ACVILI_006788 [Mesorhizobium sp. USDA 4775]|uniref:hypothetical protein n=1 Tax=Mesorhizobium jarvisii TaxID=1777867 RepID=UPI001F0A5160|nr:hypothetical protein [Mesorhizobium jarvisii]MCH4561272.1 hypothetical protein [Mesorhizobium jarvisii]
MASRRWLTWAQISLNGLATTTTSVPGRVPKIQATADLAALKQALETLAASSFKDKCTAAAASATELGKDADSLDGLSRESLLKSALELYDGAACPVCDTPLEPDAELCWNLGDEADQAALCGFNSMTSIPSWNLAPAMSFGN